jgi:hypothetical protein
MTGIRSKRRRVRNQDPEVLRAIRGALMTGASAPEVVRALTTRQANGEFPAGSIPSARTVSAIARESDVDESGPWHLTDADPATVSLVLLVLAEVVRRTEGRVASLTQSQARLLPVIYRAMEPRWTKLPSDEARAWQAYVWTRFYLSWVRRDQDAEDVALLFAAMQSNGRWPITRWFQIDRVSNAVGGWLPPELVEVPK